MKLENINDNTKVKFKSRKEIRRILIKILEDNSTDEAIELSDELSDILHDYNCGVIKSGLDIYLDRRNVFGKKKNKKEEFNIKIANDSIFDNVVLLSNNTDSLIFANNRMIKKVKEKA